MGDAMKLTHQPGHDCEHTPMVRVRLCPNGAASHSPGLPRFAATLGLRPNGISTPTGLCHVRRPMTQPRWGRRRCLTSVPRVAAMRGNPGLCDAAPLGQNRRTLRAVLQAVRFVFASLCLFAFFVANSAFAQEPPSQKPAVAPPANP